MAFYAALIEKLNAKNEKYGSNILMLRLSTK